MIWYSRSVQLACIVMIAGFFVVSCNGGSPIVPSSEIDNSVTGATDTPGADGLPYPGYSLEAIPEYAADEVLILLEDWVVPTETDGSVPTGGYSTVANLLSENGLGVIRIIPTSFGTVYRLSILDDTPVPAKADELKALPEVKIAEPNYTVRMIDAPYFPNDPFWENDTDYDEDPRTNVWEQFGPSKIGASAVWGDTRGEDMVVCVIDTGVQWWHEDLIENMWVNEGEIPDNGIDDDENGYIDDIYGWDTDQDDNDITEYNANQNYHGTACAGVVAATQDNDLGCSGIAPATKIMGIRIAFNTGFQSAVIEGVEYAVNHGAHIITMSFISSSNAELMKLAMDNAWADGLILVAGAGNTEGQPIYYPCSWPSVVKVGGTSPFSQAWDYDPIDEVRISIGAGFGWGSTYGNGQEVVAFGEHYITTYGGGPDEYWSGASDFFFGGTSNATPMVAGAYALLRGYYPGETAEWLRDRMTYTSDDLHGPGYDIETGYGRVNVIRAVYGSDRYAAEEDGNGFVDVAPHEGIVIDSLYASDHGYYDDTEDLYKFTAGLDGFVAVDLDIYTYGENLDLQIYDAPGMLPEDLVEESTIENHGNNTHEIVGAECLAGETYYIRIFPVNLGDSTSYTLTIMEVENYININNGSNDPGFVHMASNNVYLGWVEFDVGFRVNLKELIFSQTGSMPPYALDELRLFRDADGDKVFGTDDRYVANASFNGTNRAVLDDINEQITFADSPERFFITIDLAGITENAQYQLALTSYKDVQTIEGLEVPKEEFPRYFGPYSVGVDVDAPTWDSEVGVQDVDSKYEAAKLYWNSASDPLTPPVVYNVYWSDSLPFDFATANKAAAVNTSGGGSYDYSWQVNGLVNDQEFYVAVRAEDQAGNEEENPNYMAVIPSDVSDPTAPQIISTFNSSGSAWEVAVDPDNPRVFLADYNGGLLTIDVSDPTDPYWTDIIYAPAVTSAEYDGTYVYAACANGLLIIDPDGVSGAEQLSLVPFPSALDAAVSGNWCYVSNSGNDILPVDVTDPESPVTYPTVDSGNVGYGMDIANGYLYVATNQKLRVFDLAIPSAPAHTSTVGTNYAYEVDAIGDRLYVTYWYASRMKIFSLADPANPSQIGNYLSQVGWYAADVTPFNGYMYFGTNINDVEVLNVTNPGSIQRVGNISTGGPDGLDSNDTFVFSAENEAGLRIIL